MYVVWVRHRICLNYVGYIYIHIYVHIYVHIYILVYIYIYIYIYIVDVVPLMKTAGVVENSGHCKYSMGLKCF